jgi:hypothetical protein
MAAAHWHTWWLAERLEPCRRMGPPSPFETLAMARQARVNALYGSSSG